MQRRTRRRNTAKEQFWRKIISEFDPERHTVRTWCEQHAVSEPSFYAWRRELKRRDQAQPVTARLQFVPVELGPTLAAPVANSAEVTIVLPSSLRLQVAVEQLAAVLDVLESR